MYSFWKIFSCFFFEIDEPIFSEGFPETNGTPSTVTVAESSGNAAFNVMYRIALNLESIRSFPPSEGKSKNKIEEMEFKDFCSRNNEKEITLVED